MHCTTLAPCRCRCAYHLPCASGAPNVALEGETFELWCPHHADTDNSDEDYNFQQAARPRRQTGELAEAQGTGAFCWQL